MGNVMSQWTLRFGLTAIALSTAGAALCAPPAKQGPAASPPPVVAVPKVKSPPKLDAIFGIFDKLFPPQPEPDPARLSLARTSAAAMWPEGSYGKMMTGFMGGVVDHAMQLKGSDFAAIAGKPEKASAHDLSIHDQAAAKDPYFDQRVAAIRAVVAEEFGKVSTVVDPRMREGLARAMARRFDAQQLNDINRFFATPAGRSFAGQYLQLWVDPDTIRSIFASMPELFKLMPEMQAKIKAADDRFPKPPKPPAKPEKTDKTDKKK
jgi:hypothetical protein